MKYFEVTFTLSPCTQDARDLLSAMSGEAGFETFEDTADGLTGYVQQQLFNRQELDNIIAVFPIEGVDIRYKIEEAEDRDWNAEWEEEGFDPIVVSGQLTIHDGRHLPAVPTPLSIEIDARMAFGTGTHQTTRMVCATLLDILRASDTASTAKNVLDCGCGTGILSICALKLGAGHCTAYDIDQWSVDNTRHNSIINQVEQQMTILHGDATLLDNMEPCFDIVMANINRNILLNDMPRFADKMRPGATLIVSGFYQADIPLLQQKAESLGMILTGTRSDDDWACLTFKKNITL